MPRSSAPQPLAPQELADAVSQVAYYLSQAQARFSISGGAASTLIRMQYGLPLRSTDDIDLVVQPTATINAERISAWLPENYPGNFIVKMVHGVPSPALAFQRLDGSIKHIEVEIFDIRAWPQRPQYNLDDSRNEVTLVDVSGVQVPVFGPCWQVREKIVTAYERQGSRKEMSDLDDACTLLQAVQHNSIDLTSHKDAVRHILKRRPEDRELLQLKLICPEVLGDPWNWFDSASVYWRFEGHELRYLDQDLRRHKFKWSKESAVYYLTVGGYSWYYDQNTSDLELWA